MSKIFDEHTIIVNEPFIEPVDLSSEGITGIPYDEDCTYNIQFELDENKAREEGHVC